MTALYLHINAAILSDCGASHKLFCGDEAGNKSQYLSAFNCVVRGGFALSQRMQFQLSEKDFRAFALQKDFTAARADFKRFIDHRAVESNPDVAAVAKALKPVPFTVRLLHVAWPAKIHLVLPLAIFSEPVETSPTVNREALSGALPGRPAVGIAFWCNLGRDARNDGGAVGISTAQEQEVSGRTLKNIALNRRLESALAIVAVAVRSGAVDENPRVARSVDALAPGPVCLAPLELGDELIVLEFLLSAQVTQSIAGDVNHPIGDREDMARIAEFRIHEPGIETPKVRAVEDVNRLRRNNGLSRAERCLSYDQREQREGPEG